MKCQPFYADWKFSLMHYLVCLREEKKNNDSVIEYTSILTVWISLFKMHVSLFAFAELGCHIL